MTQEGGESLPSFNFEAKESSKEEECAAICKLRGVDAATAPIALQLKAIDEEYHHLVGSGQSGKADHVQGLFLWKSKQASQVILLIIQVVIMILVLLIACFKS